MIHYHHHISCKTAWYRPTILQLPLWRGLPKHANKWCLEITLEKWVGECSNKMLLPITCHPSVDFYGAHRMKGGPGLPCLRRHPTKSDYLCCIRDIYVFFFSLYHFTLCIYDTYHFCWIISRLSFNLTIDNIERISHNENNLFYRKYNDNSELWRFRCLSLQLIPYFSPHEGLDKNNVVFIILELQLLW